MPVRAVNGHCSMRLSAGLNVIKGKQAAGQQSVGDRYDGPTIMTITTGYPKEVLFGSGDREQEHIARAATEAAS